MTTLQPAKPTPTGVTPQPVKGHLSHELKWCAAEADHDIQTATTAMSQAHRWACDTLASLAIVVLAIPIVLSQTLTETTAPIVEGAAYIAGLYAMFSVIRTINATSKSHQTLANITTTKRVEVGAEIVDVTTLLTQNHQEQKTQ